MKVFDRYFLEYDNWFEENQFAYWSELKMLKSFFPLRQGNSLEIGVGSGKFAEPLRLKYGIDSSVKMLELARSRGINVKRGVAEKIPFSANEFNLVLMVTTICFLKDVNKAFAEINRVLQPGGRVIIGFVDKNSFLGQCYLKKQNKSKFYKKAVFYSVEDVLQLLKENNFKIKKIKQTLFSLPANITKIERSKKGYGRGGFVGILAVKK